MNRFSRVRILITFTALTVGLVGAACGSNAQYLPTPEDTSRAALQKAQQLNYDLHDFRLALVAYTYIIQNFTYEDDAESIEDIVWAHYDTGLIEYRERQFQKAQQHFQIVLDMGARALEDFKFIQDDVVRVERSLRIQNAVTLTVRLIEKMSTGRTRHNATYSTGTEDAAAQNPPPPPPPPPAPVSEETEDNPTTTPPPQNPLAPGDGATEPPPDEPDPNQPPSETPPADPHP